MRIEVTNSLSRIWAPPSVLKELDTLASYPIDGAQYSKAFRMGMWDGREHLLRKSKRGDFHLIPTGILAELDDLMVSSEVVDMRRQPGERRQLNWVGKKMRGYQEDAANAALKERGLFTGRGMMNLPIRSGKTYLAARLVHLTGLRTVFVVPSDLLLFQTAKAFQEALSPAPVAMFGAGIHNTDWITISTAQTLLKRPKMARKLLDECDLLIIDEAHHLEGPVWRALALRSDAPLKIGLSATIFVSQLKDNDKASVWLKACTGPILYRISMARLIKLGYLMRPRIVFFRFQHQPGSERWSWLRVVKESLAQNRRRNCLIVDIAEQVVREGKKILIDTGRHDQMRQLKDFMASRGISAELVHGKTPANKRWGIIEGFQKGITQCLIGTVFGEGVDIPELEVVINAEGQKSGKAAIQRMRNLTPNEGKGEVIFVDIADVGQPYLAGHALERLKLYRGMRGFNVQVCDGNRLVDSG